MLCRIVRFCPISVLDMLSIILGMGGLRLSRVKVLRNRFSAPAG